jgi:transcriptional regulator with XRE-family HTH domain
VTTGRKRPGPRPSPYLATPSEQLRRILESRGGSAYALARLADLAPTVVSRFLSGRRSLTLHSFDRLAGALGLRLVEPPRRARPSATAAEPTEPAEPGA